MAQSLADALMQQQQPQTTGNPEGLGPIPLASMPQALGQAPTLADGWDYNANAYKDYVAKQQADLVARGLNDPQTGWPTRAGWLDAAHQIGNSLLMGTTAPGIRAFHGSPHSFDKFQMEKIGTGEGNQAFGHGLYFAGDEGVARSYRDNLSADADGLTNSITLDGKVIGSNIPSNALTPEQRAALLIHYNNGITQKAINDAQGMRDIMPPGSDVQQMHQETLDALQNNDWTGRVKPYKGSMYEVNLGVNPEHMLDWDKPVSEQSQYVKDQLQDTLSRFEPEDLQEMTGADLYHQKTRESRWSHPAYATGGLPPADWNPPVEGGAFLLHQAGIPGIRYLDGQSRAAGEGTSNYVMFNPAHIEILRKYGLLGTLGGAAASPFGFAAAGQGQQ